MSPSSTTAMPITADQVRHIARLARVRIGGGEEAAFYAGQLSRILALVDEMNRVDTDGVAPLSHPGAAALRLRDDRADAADADRRDEFLSLAPASEDGLYLVPKVIDDGDS